MYASLNGRHEAWLEMSSAKSVFDSRGAAELISFYPVVATEDLPADPDYPFTAIVGTQHPSIATADIVYVMLSSASFTKIPVPSKIKLQLLKGAPGKRTN